MKERIDVLLVERGLAASREKAQGLIMAGLVYVDHQKADKPGAAFSNECEIEVRGGERFVSRGGQKLEKAIEMFCLSLDNKICADIGASTGGFTDCMLQHGARRVYAVDVGYGQLAWSLRSDARVINLERTNVRSITQEQVPDRLDFFSVDVSFISLKLVLPPVTALLAESAAGVCLIKPQFEAGREKVGKNGVVRDAAVHKDVICAVLSYLPACGLSAAGLTHSPVRGPRGNIEYLLYVKRTNESVTQIALDVDAAVMDAHTQLAKE